MYRALYRKWRPQRFEDVVDQQGIVTALKNQVASGRVGHAYLFTGVRGTGKTTCAKIFARAVNCEDPQDGDPCGVCPICKGIENGSILDVVEMDAASNNSVEDIRDIRDETAYTPSVCRYKVYIVDEVHMLSVPAFNALLKTLEEPPPHVIFILATTEIQKVPATILSRCQRYDFTRITPEGLTARVEQVAQSEALSLTPGAAALIARLADGAMRDALSILDTCASVADPIDEAVVRRMAGVADRGYLFALSDAVAAQNGVEALAILGRLRQQSVDMKRLTEELIAHYRNLLLAALPDGKRLLAGVSPEEEARYAETGAQLGQRDAIRAIRALGGALERTARGGDQRIELELALFSLTEPPAAPQPAPVAYAQPAAGFVATAPQPFAAAPQPAAFASAPVPAQPVQPVQTVPPPVQPIQQEDAFPPPPQEAPPLPEDLPPWETEPLPPRPVTAKAVPTPAPTPAPAAPASPQPGGDLQPFAAWPQVVKVLSERDPMLNTYLRRSRAYQQGKRVLIDGGPMFNDFLRQNKDSQKLIKKVLAEVTGQPWAIGPYTAHTEKRGPSVEDSLARLQSMGVELEVRDSLNSRG